MIACALPVSTWVDDHPIQLTVSGCERLRGIPMWYHVWWGGHEKTRGCGRSGHPFQKVRPGQGCLWGSHREGRYDGIHSEIRNPTVRQLFYHTFILTISFVGSFVGDEIFCCYQKRNRLGMRRLKSFWKSFVNKNRDESKSFQKISTSESTSRFHFW